MSLLDHSFIYVFGFIYEFNFKSFEIIMIEIKYTCYNQNWLQYTMAKTECGG